jgi:hypothetical protein
VLDSHNDSQGNGLGLAANWLRVNWMGSERIEFQTQGRLSDIRSKDPQSVHPIQDAIPRVKALNPVRFLYKTQPVDSPPKMGFIAQELEAVLPELVHLGSEGMKVIEEGSLVALLAQAIKEQQAQIDALRAELAGANLDLAQVGIGRMAIQADLQVS